MKEDFLHFVWQYQQFAVKNIKTTTNQAIKIIKTGFKNHNQGPDFSNGRITIDDIEWVGNIEIHVFSKDWLAHAHQNDRAYDNVILHVVWQNNADIFRTDGTLIPTLELKPIIFENTLQKYSNLIAQNTDIVCAESFASVPEIQKTALKDQAMVRRLENKSKFIFEILEKTNQDWEETAFRLLFRNFGFKLNSDTFLRLAENIPWKIIQKHRDNNFQIEALLFGVAGFLKIPTDDYAQKLASEYEFLQNKYQLNSLEKSEWKFAKTRPSNFPTVRISQLAMILGQTQNLFSFFMENTRKSEIETKIRLKPNEYWQNHYDFNKVSAEKLNGIGVNSLETLIINTNVNLMAVFGLATNEPEYFEKAMALLEQFKPEKNNITEKWSKLNLKISNAFDSQAVIEQLNGYCSQKRCVSCTIGAYLLKN